MRTDKVALLTCESEIGLCSPPIPLTSRRESCYANLERIVRKGEPGDGLSNSLRLFMQ
jgi:hypothetical protein